MAVAVPRTTTVRSFIELWNGVRATTRVRSDGGPSAGEWGVSSIIRARSPRSDSIDDRFRRSACDALDLRSEAVEVGVAPRRIVGVDPVEGEPVRSREGVAHRTQAAEQGPFATLSLE